MQVNNNKNIEFGSRRICVITQTSALIIPFSINFQVECISTQEMNKCLSKFYVSTKITTKNYVA